MLNNILTKTRMVGLGEVSLYALLGYAVVFFGIAFLIFVVWAIGKAFTKSKPTQKQEKPQPKPVEKTEVVPVQANEDEISDEILAVITATISAYYETAQPQCEFIVKRIKRI